MISEDVFYAFNIYQFKKYQVKKIGCKNLYAS